MAFQKTLSKFLIFFSAPVHVPALFIVTLLLTKSVLVTLVLPQVHLNGRRYIDLLRSAPGVPNYGAVFAYFNSVWHPGMV